MMGKIHLAVVSKSVLLCGAETWVLSKRGWKGMLRATIDARDK
jgi:hypothetical protein